MIIRLTLALLFVIPAALAYPWQSTADRWLLGVAVAVVVVAFAWWRGLFVTTMVARRIAMLRRRNHVGGSHQSSEFATAVLRVEPRDQTDLPLGLIAGYIDRYGIDFDKVRVTSRDVGGARTTWVGLTLGAADNLSALAARSSRMPLQDTVDVAARRLADHLRETGWDVSTDDAAATPVPEQAKETWRGISDGRGYLAAYRIRVDEQLADTLAALSTSDNDETWTALEFTGSRAHPEVAAACAIRTAERPGSRAPLTGLTPERGEHRPALAALATDSDRRLSATPVPVPADLLSQLRWPTGAALSRT
ncbi:type VII secretion protein EccE [Mycolicibacterium hippocampi]|uniref:Membrane protein EccE3, component of Type VII secretion system ESX-3 n=1 Tax=Mycolicibacterium hippocampi TaxID=659824 RepID=A0A850PT12_9MYCO|nr:type VII secretion protein EccE [Mycolicibacterium hippocampi]NVN51214.1 Membrane protein EccE3, component of Type VII secretion system ESX-3 [Mycolicibacterium hippocampi]